MKKIYFYFFQFISLREIRPWLNENCPWVLLNDQFPNSDRRKSKIGIRESSNCAELWLLISSNFDLKGIWKSFLNVKETAFKRRLSVLINVPLLSVLTIVDDCLVHVKLLVLAWTTVSTVAKDVLIQSVSMSATY